MNPVKKCPLRAVACAVLCAVLVLLSDLGHAQPGPPMLPPIPFSALDFWPLEAPPWSSLYGQSARASTNLNTSPSWDYTGTCLSVDTNGPVFLQEDCFQGAWSNIVFDSGSLSLFFQANWTSVSDGGLGPTNWAALVSVGHWTSNASQSSWIIAIDPVGSNLVMEAQAGGSNQVVFNVPITYDAGTWHQIFITYSLTNCCVYLEGQPATNVAPIHNYPGGADCTNFGMFFGSLSTSGACQCHGQLQWLATYDYPLSADEVAADYANVSSYISWWGGSLPGGGFHPADGAPAPPGGYGGGGGGGGGSSPPPPTPTYTTNDLYLTIAWTNFNQAVVVNLINTTNGTNYLLLASTNLQGPWVTNQSLPGAIGTNTAAYPIGILDAADLYFIAQKGPGPTNGTLKWVVNLIAPTNAWADGYDSPGFDSSPAISPLGPIYMVSGNSNLFAIDPIFGTILWSNSPPGIPYSGEGMGSAAVASNGIIYAGYFDGDLHTFSPYDETNWFQPAGDACSIYSTPAIASTGLIIVSSDEQVSGGPAVVSGVTAFNPDGTTNWFFQPQDLYNGNGGDADGSQVVGPDGTVYFMAEGYRLYALSAAGQLKWFLPMQTPQDPGSSPAIAADDSIIAGTASQFLFCVNPDGSLKWTCDFGNTTASQVPFEPAIGPSGVIYCGAFGSQLNAVNPDGTTNWIFVTPDGSVVSTPALAADGTIYFGAGNMDGTFYALATNGSVLWSTNVGAPINASPAILPDGSVVVADEAGNLYCFWGSAPPATNASWPTFQHDPAHTGQATPATIASYCGAPFLFNGDNDGMGNFYFKMTGPPGSSGWNVYASTNLTNTGYWTNLATNLTLDSVTGNAAFTDTNATNTSKFYLVGNGTCCSKVIGFVNLTITNGTNLIADQLYQVDEALFNIVAPNPPNSLVSLFTFSNAWGSAQSGTEIYQWNGSGFVNATNAGGTQPSWYPGLVGGDMTLLPGEGVFMRNTSSSPFPVWFNGLVREQQIFHIQPMGTNVYSTNYLSATAPIAGYITNVTGYVPSNGDTNFLWNNSAGHFVSYPYISNAWTSGCPSVAVGEGFVLVTSNTYTWTNTFQQCP